MARDPQTRAAIDLGQEGLSRETLVTDRPGLALQNAFMGDLPGAWRSLLTPKDLTLAERRSLGRKWGINKGIYAQVFDTVTNPILLLSLAVSHVFPVAAGENIFKLSRAVKSLGAKYPVLRRVASMQGLFQGVRRVGSKADFVDEFGRVIFDTNDFRSRYGSKYAELLAEYRRGSGRLPSRKDQILVASWLDGLHKPLRGFQGKKNRIRIGSGSTTFVSDGVGTLMPGLESNMGAANLKLAKGIRGILNEQWAEVFSDIKGRKRILQALKNQRARGMEDQYTNTMMEFIQNPKKIPDYFPRRLLQSETDFRKLVETLTASGSSKKFAKSARRKIEAMAGPEARKRKFAMTPDFEDLKTVSEFVDKESMAKLQALTKARIVHAARIHPKNGLRPSSIAKLQGMSLDEIEQGFEKVVQPAELAVVHGAIRDFKPRQYSLKLMPVISQYNHTMGGTFAWTVKGGGAKIAQMLDELKLVGAKDPIARYQADLLENTYIPIAMGRGTFRNSIRAQLYAHASQQVALKAEHSPVIRKILGEKLQKTVVNGLRESRGAFNLAALNRKVAGYFYLSTLGLNPASALKNTLQLVLTTGPTIGFRTTAAGLSEAYRKSHKYFSLRLGRKALTHEQALREAYPEFASTGLVATPLTEEVVQNTLHNAYEIAALPSKAAKVSEKVQRAMMSMFTASETTVRLATFEAGMIHARRAKLPTEAALEFSRKLVERTQFLTGPQNTPEFLLDKSPVIRQLTQFPLRTLEFFTTTALSLGSGAINPKTGKPMNVLGVNPGTFARMIAGSVIGLELGDMLGVNVGDALVQGALPTFQPGGKVLAPFPIVPPILQLGGALGLGVASQDFTELIRSSPLLFPGGVSAFRAAGLIPPGIPGAPQAQAFAKTFRRTYADYSQPAPDGRIAVYSGKGTLKGFYRPWELVRHGLGIRGGDMESEQRLLNTLVTQRDNIREEKRAYLDARQRNDPGGANRIKQSFKQRFGFDLPVSEKDIAASQLRRQVTRLEQVVRTLPPGPAREQMVSLIAATLGVNGQQVLGVDPQLLSQPNAVRQASRTGTLQRRGRGGTASEPRTTSPRSIKSIPPQSVGSPA